MLLSATSRIAKKFRWSYVNSSNLGAESSHTNLSKHGDLLAEQTSTCDYVPSSGSIQLFRLILTLW